MQKHLTFNDENVVVRISAGEQIIKWEAFKEWKRIAGCYLLIFSNGKRAIIPKSDIPSGEIQRFENLLMQKIDKTTIKRQADGN